MINGHRFLLYTSVILLNLAVSIFSETIPFSLKRGIPQIEIIINDSVKATFAIDTGADQVYVDKTFAEKHGLLSGGKMPVRPVAGMEQKAEAFQVFLRSMKVGELKQTIVGAVVIDLPLMLKDTSSGLPDGVLGYSFLKSRKLLLNYIDSTVEFSLSDSVLSETKTAQVPFVLNRHLIIVNTEINDSVDAKMILDTGASWSIFSPALAKRLNVQDSAEIPKIRLDGRVTTANAKIVVRDISDISASVKNDEINGILGTSYLMGRRLIIDYPNNQLIVFSNR